MHAGSEPCTKENQKKGRNPTGRRSSLANRSLLALPESRVEQTRQGKKERDDGKISFRHLSC